MALDPAWLPLPPMGFNTWNRFGMKIDQDLIRGTMAALHETGLQDAGYVYVNIDDGWMAPERDSRGRLVPDPVRFPDGIARLADEAHALGFKLGIYSDCGLRTCGGLPASYGHEREDAETFAGWGVDYLKHDWCNVPLEEFPGLTEGEVAKTLYGRMSRAIEDTGHRMVLSLCNWGRGNPWEWARGVGHLWRTTPDISDSFEGGLNQWTLGVVDILKRNLPLWSWAGPGGFNDPDMLEVGNGGLTKVQEQSHFALWCLMAAPLLIGTDVRTAKQDTLALLKHPGLIAINQDPLGQQARPLETESGHEILAKPLQGGRTAVGVFNPSMEPRHITLDWQAVAGGLPYPLQVQDVWTAESSPVSGPATVTVAGHATGLWLVGAR